MALTFKEKRDLTKVVNAKIGEIQAGGMDFKAKRAATKALNEALAKLGGQGVETSDSGLLADLVAGKFNDLAPLAFLKKLEDTVAELNGNIEPVKEPTIAYIQANEDKILESAAEFQGALACMGMGSSPCGQSGAIRYTNPPGTDGGIPQFITIDIDTPFEDPTTTSPRPPRPRPAPGTTPRARSASVAWKSLWRTRRARRAPALARTEHPGKPRCSTTTGTSSPRWAATRITSTCS